MTFSIVARDPETGDVGVAVASKVVAVGAVAPFAQALVGAISSQSAPNVTYGPDGLARLAAGEHPKAVLEALTAPDAMATMRQVGIVDATGRAASYTGASCVAWAGGRVAPGVAAQGNMLTGPEVVDALMDTYLGAKGTFPQRLLAALRAADQAGGDKRGRQSAALLVRREKGGIAGLDDRWIDLRVDDHTDPTAELARLYDLLAAQNNPLTAENLPKVASMLVDSFTSAIKQAVSKEPEAEPQLISWDPDAANPAAEAGPVAEPGAGTV
jgi:uncharacterized Ntn-hydrolase superfamily protein